MSRDVSESLLAQAALAYQFLSTQSITKTEADLWPCLPAHIQMSGIGSTVSKGSSDAGALQSIACEQAISDGQPMSTASPVQPAAGGQSQHATMVESEPLGRCYSVSTEEAQGSNDCSLASRDSMQPAGVANSLAQSTGPHVSADTSSLQDTMLQVQSIASLEDQSVEASGDEFDADSENEESDIRIYNDEFDADSDNEAKSDSALEPRPLAVRCQLSCTLKGKVQSLASTAVGFGYHAAGAVYGSVLGMRQGLKRSS